MGRRVLWVWAAVLGLPTALGCGTSAPATPESSPAALHEPGGAASDVCPADLVPPPTAAEPAILPARPVDRAGFDDWLARQQGQVVLVDYWATWCGPCREQFAHTVELAEKFRDRGLVVASLSLDDPEDASAMAEVAQFLDDQEARFTHLVSQWGGGDESYERFAIDNGAIPHLQLFDHQGKLVRKFASGDPTSRSATPQEVEAAIVELLERGSSGAAAE